MVQIRGQRSPNGPKWPQDGPEPAARWAQTGSKDGPKTAQNEHRVSTRRSFLSIVSVVSIRRCFHAFSKKTRLASTRRSFWASPWARNLFWGAPDGTSFSSWVPRRAQEAPGLPPRRVQSQKTRLASTRRPFFSKMSVSSRRGSFFLFPGLPPRRAQAPKRRLDETRRLVLTLKKPALLTIARNFPAHCLKRKPLQAFSEFSF